MGSGSVTLEAIAARAGAALACSFSNSDEYNAALIAERRAAGIYGPRRHRRHMIVSAAGVSAGLAFLLLILL
ncbi:MAG: hypothetical protein JOZ70_08965 [Pseudolabrys sp.]|nr:hypothetical protein [Pseudolabrys sp.]MBV9955368.1 hypothetical protein [Pseudolabrys sp.]